MSLFSFLRKNKQQSASEDSAFYSRAEEGPAATRNRGKRKQGKTPGNGPADPVLPEKKRARRRLIGAVALVLAAIVGLPMLLDSEPRPLPDDIAIQIPSKDRAAPPAPASAAPPASVTSPAASKVAAADSLDPKEEVVEPPPASANAGSPPKPDNAVPAAKPEEERRPASREPKQAASKKPDEAVHAEARKTKNETDHEQARARAARAEDAARAKAILAGKPDPKDAEENDSRFVIQVAALATREKVDELRARLKNAGIKSYTQQVATASGGRTRIRVGPFASREEAERMRARIIMLGLRGALLPD